MATQSVGNAGSAAMAKAMDASCHLAVAMIGDLPSNSGLRGGPVFSGGLFWLLVEARAG